MEEVPIQFTLWYFCLVVYGKFSGGKNFQNKYVFQSIMWTESCSPLSHDSGGFLKIPQKNMKRKPSISRYTHLFPVKIHEFWGRKRRTYKWLPPNHYPPSITPKPKVVPHLLGGHRCRRLEDGGWGEDGYWCNLGKNFPKTSKRMFFLLWALDICPKVLWCWETEKFQECVDLRVKTPPFRQKTSCTILKILANKRQIEKNGNMKSHESLRSFILHKGVPNQPKPPGPKPTNLLEISKAPWVCR